MLGWAFLLGRRGTVSCLRHLCVFGCGGQRGCWVTGKPLPRARALRAEGTGLRGSGAGSCQQRAAEGCSEHGVTARKESVASPCDGSAQPCRKA